MMSTKYYYILSFIFVFFLSSTFANAEETILPTNNLASSNHTKREILFRIAPQFGVIGKLQPEVSKFGIERFIFLFVCLILLLLILVIMSS